MSEWVRALHCERLVGVPTLKRDNASSTPKNVLPVDLAARRVLARLRACSSASTSEIRQALAASERPGLQPALAQLLQEGRISQSLARGGGSRWSLTPSGSLPELGAIQASPGGLPEGSEPHALHKLQALPLSPAAEPGLVLVGWPQRRQPATAVMPREGSFWGTMSTMATMTRAQIEEALRTLGEVAQAEGHHIELFAVGGAVMVLKFNARPATKDIDAVILGPAPASLVRTMAERVATQLGWPTDWLNDGAKGYVGADVQGDVLFEAPGVTVRAPPLAQMLALKLGAWRDDVDMDDAEVVLRAMTGSREETWNQVVTYLPRGQELKAQYAFQQLWEMLHGDTT